MTENTLARLEARGLDVELADRLGFGSAQRVAGEPAQRYDALVIPFVRNGKVVRRKYKLWDAPEGAGRYQQDKGGVRCVWNEDVLSDAKLFGQTWILTEGELDALTAIQCGYERTSSVPDGAPMASVKDAADSLKYAWVKELKALLSKDNVPEIILAVDGDEAGAALLQDLSVLLGRYRCKYLVYPKAPEAAREQLGRDRLKDLNEVKQFYGLKGVVETISRAEWIKVDGVYRMSELPPAPNPPIFHIGFNRFGDHFKLRLGDFSVWTGTPGSGKSTFLNDLLCRVAFNHGIKIAWASFEQRPQTDHKRYLRTWYIGQLRNHVCPADVPIGVQLGGAGEFWTDSERRAADAWIDAYHVFLVPHEDEDVTLDWFLEKSEGAVEQHGAKVIVGDPWNEMDHDYDARSMTEAQYINSAIKTLRRFGRAFQAHVALVAHPTKMLRNGDGTLQKPGLYDINGGAVWYNKADLGVVVHRDGETETSIKTAKSRFHDVIGKPGTVKMELCSEDRHYREISGGEGEK